MKTRTHTKCPQSIFMYHLTNSKAVKKELFLSNFLHTCGTYYNRNLLKALSSGKFRCHPLRTDPIGFYHKDI